MIRAALLFLLLLLAGCDRDAATAGTASGGLRIGALLQESDSDAEFDRAERIIPFHFPTDHGAHPTFRTEWWYLTANLEAATGERFGLQFTIFRQGLRGEGEAAPGWQAQQLYLAHFAVAELDTQTHTAHERFSRAHPDLAGVRGEPPQVFIGGWQIDFEADALRVRADAGAHEIALEFDAAKPVVLQGDRGLSRKSPGNASYYYSFPRLKVDGRLRVDERWHEVTGLGWFDHEWSTSVLSDAQVGWDWFSLQLDSGEDLMAFRLRRADGQRDAFDHGVRVAAYGAYQALDLADFELAVTRRWRDPHGVTWPVAWTLRLADQELVIEAAFDDQRMQTLVAYWEGAVIVRNTEGEQIGRGYMELTGYR